MQDAVVLTNCLHNMPDWSSRSIKNALEDYYQQRFERAEDQFQRSGYTTKIMSGQVKKKEHKGIFVKLYSGSTLMVNPNILLVLKYSTEMVGASSSFCDA